MDLFLPCVPPTTTHHSKKVVRVGKWTRLGDTDALIAAKQTIDVLLLPHRPAAPMSGNVSLTLEFTWPWRSGTSKKVRALGVAPKTTKPDCSNLAKTTEDRLVRLRFLDDDGLVSELIVRKFYGDYPGIRIVLIDKSLSGRQETT